MSMFASLVGSYNKPFWKPPNSPQDDSALPTASTIKLSSNEQRTLEASRVRRHNKDANDELAILSRRTNNITREIQYLLDAQATALVVGRDPEETESQSNSSVSASRVIPVRQPQEKPIGLNAARQGIMRAMRKLASTKTEEVDVLNSKALESKNILQKIESWESRRRSLEHDISNVRDQTVTKKMQDLEDESSSLREQIDVLERQLWELKSQHRAVESELATLENSVQSKLSSYNASLELVDTEVKQFLGHPPSLMDTVGNRFVNNLPKNRRTLEILKDSITDQDSHLRRQQDLATTERTALAEGMELWKAVMSQIFSLESKLRNRLQTSPAGSLDDLKEEFQKTIQAVEQEYTVAEQKNWNLLLCCIGAELDALRRGRAMVFGTDSGLSTPRETGARNGSAALMSTTSTSPTRPSSADGSDGPGPDLLVSHEIDE